LVRDDDEKNSSLLMIVQIRVPAPSDPTTTKTRLSHEGSNYDGRTKGTDDGCQGISARQ